MIDEGWQLNHSKTHILPKSQQQRLAGIVINQHPNLARKEYETLKAILHRCSHNGFDAENRHNHPHFIEHLKGRISFLHYINHARGQKLLTKLEQILS